jgi:lipopolysaccharide/colanic/teichoic acid biosynthesis glycosyltransferase
MGVRADPEAQQRAIAPPRAALRPVAAIAVTARSLPLLRRLGEALYRWFEILAAVTALVLLAPVMLIEALLIALDSPGPVLFFHRRAGQSRPMPGRKLTGRTDLKPPPGGFEPDKLYWVPTTFWFVKFRTMRQDAVQRYPELYWWHYDINPEEFPDKYYQIADDPRLSKIGKWLRKTTLDELPNFWNVVIGQTRLVGPRPEHPELLAYYTDEQLLKFTVKPGLTCLSMVSGRGELSVGEKIALDLEYVRNRSLLLDLKILFWTVKAVLARRGAI